MSKTKSEKLLTVKEVSTLLNISTFTVRQFVANGVLSSLKTGNRYKFKHKDIKEFVLENELNSTTKVDYITDSLLKTEEVAELLNCSVYTICNLTKSKELAHLSFGGRYRYRREVIEAYIESKITVTHITTYCEKGNYSFLYN